MTVHHAQPSGDEPSPPLRRGGDSLSPEATLPHGWRWVALDEICICETGTRDPRKEPDAPFHYVDISSVDNQRKLITGARALSGKEAPSRARQVIRANDVLVATTRPNLNAVALVPPDLGNQISSTGFCVLRSNGEVEPEYLFAFVQTPVFVRSLSDLVKGALYPAVTDGQVRAQRLPLPPLPEQRRIAARLREQLSEAAEARAAVQAQLAAAQALPAAHLGAIFSGYALAKWPTRALADVAEISGGVTLGRDLRGRPARPVPYLRVANVKDGYLDLAHMKEVEATEDEIDACRLQFGDLLLTEGGDPDKLGRGTYWQEQLPECIHQNHIFRVRFDPAAFDPAFVASQVGSPYGKAYFLAHAKQTTGIATINRTVLSKYPLLAPPLSEQRAVATRLEAEQKAAADLTAHLKEKLIALDHLPAALLREAFSGRF